jgi:ribosomal-protein-alanine N-acetyltransferase
MHNEKKRLLQQGDVRLRYITLDDCTGRYVGWLNDPQVNRFLETRWHPQDLEAVCSFVQAALDNPLTHLFAIEVDTPNGCVHVGNIKLGPVNVQHQHADISYFIGDAHFWGKGVASKAIALATDFGFNILKLLSIRAGLYANNVGSAKALEKNGYTLCARLPSFLNEGEARVDQLLYVKTKEGV